MMPHTTTDSPLQLHARLANGHMVDARVASARPHAAQLLIGRSPAEAVAMVPRLFALCSHAQGTAARLACDAAQSSTR